MAVVYLQGVQLLEWRGSNADLKFSLNPASSSSRVSQCYLPFCLNYASPCWRVEMSCCLSESLLGPLRSHTNLLSNTNILSHDLYISAHTFSYCLLINATEATVWMVEKLESGRTRPRAVLINWFFFRIQILR